jgi:Na+/H+-translocating membrane pyrophosphatase
MKKDNEAEKRDFKKCIEISTKASLTEMIIPGIMVIFTPFALGSLFGPKAVSGYLAGVIVSGVQMAIASSNSGGAWDNAKKYIEGKIYYIYK